MAKTRDPWYDNARWLAGSLVVTVHLTSAYMYGGVPGERGGIADWFHSATFPLRLPLFSMLVGFFTPVQPTDRDFRSLTRHVILPFTFISALHVLWDWFTTGKLTFDAAVAPYTLWFMFAVIIWRAAGPYLWRFRHPLLLAVLVSLFAGQFHSLWVFGLYSTTGMFPFFVLGMKLRQEGNWLRERSVQRDLTAWGVVLAWVAVTSALFATANLSRAALGMTADYGAEDVAGLLAGMGIRLAVLVGSGATMLAALYLMPRRHIPVISYVGAGGFTIYLLHGLVLKVLRHLGVSIPTDDYRFWMFPFLVLASFALALLLGSKPVRNLVKPLVRPTAKWLFKPAEAVDHRR